MKIDGDKIVTALSIGILSYIGLTVTDNAGNIRDLKIHTHYQTQVIKERGQWIEKVNDWKKDIDLKLSDIYNRINKKGDS